MQTLDAHQCVRREGLAEAIDHDGHSFAINGLLVNNVVLVREGDVIILR